MAARGRIHFPGNPWPDGHAIATFRWSGRLVEDELVFDLHLESAGYDDEGEGTEGEDDWESPIVWGNYHRCSLSSRKWGHSGVPIAGPKRPFDFATLSGRTLLADKANDQLVLEHEDRAFHIYLLGHDAVASHRITFERAADGMWEIAWKAKVALEYTGSKTLNHELDAKITGVRFEGFDVPRDMDAADAKRRFAACVTDPEAWALMRSPNRRRFRRRDA